MTKDDKVADKPLDGPPDGSVQPGTGEEATTVSMPRGDVTGYILDMVIQLAHLAEEIGNDVLATNLAKAVQLERSSSNDPRHLL